MTCKNTFASLCSSCENHGHGFALIPKPSEVISPTPLFTSMSLESSNIAPRLEVVEAPPTDKVQTLPKEFLLGNVYPPLVKHPVCKLLAYCALD